MAILAIMLGILALMFWVLWAITEQKNTDLIIQNNDLRNKLWVSNNSELWEDK